MGENEGEGEGKDAANANLVSWIGKRSYPTPITYHPTPALSPRQLAIGAVPQADAVLLATGVDLHEALAAGRRADVPHLAAVVRALKVGVRPGPGQVCLYLLVLLEP